MPRGLALAPEHVNSERRLCAGNCWFASMEWIAYPYARADVGTHGDPMRNRPQARAFSAATTSAFSSVLDTPSVRGR